MPVLGNAFGSIKRLEIGLETTEFSEIGRRITDMTKMEIPSGIFNKIKKLPELSKMSESFPKLEKSGPVTEIVNKSPTFDKNCVENGCNQSFSVKTHAIRFVFLL